MQSASFYVPRFHRARFAEFFDVPHGDWSEDSPEFSFEWVSLTAVDQAANEGLIFEGHIDGDDGASVVCSLGKEALWVSAYSDSGQPAVEVGEDGKPNRTQLRRARAFLAARKKVRALIAGSGAVLVHDALLGRERPICIDCLDAWSQNGLDTPDASDARPTDLPCENCLAEQELAQDANS